jgi:hypothetical protein
MERDNGDQTEGTEREEVTERRGLREQTEWKIQRGKT